MPSEKISVRLGADLIEQLDAYGKQHGLDRATVVRLAILQQLGRKPPKTLPEGVVKDRSTPDPAAAGRKGAEARWGKRRKKKDG
jgi:hypothetical protein